MKNQLSTFPQWEVFFCKSASGWGNVKTVSMHVLLAGEMLKSAKQTFNISPVGGFFFAKVLLAGKMLTVSMHVLLAGEMLKTAKAIFNISPVGGLFFVENASGWGNVKSFFFFFRKCASGWGNSKKVKNVKSGRNYVCAHSTHKHSSPHF